MHTPRPSLLPALCAVCTAVTQIEIGPQLSGLLIALANIAAATLLGILGQRLRRVQQDAKQLPRPKRKKLKAQDTVLTRDTEHRQ